MKAKEAEKFVEKGMELLGAGDFRAAEKAFARALKLDEAIPIRNNLAMTVYMAGEPRRALQILEPYIGLQNTTPAANSGATHSVNPAAGETAATSAPNPFTNALAARIYCSLGQEDQARRQLQLAVRSFEDGLFQLRRAGWQQNQNSFREYTVTIMRAAADLQDHRLVFDLYRRWESHHVSWENKFLAAVACFNIGRYKRAASLWSSIAVKHQLFASMQQLAFMVERSVIPPFEMSYEHNSPEKLQKMVEKAGAGEEACRYYVQDSCFRVVMLAMILEDDSSQDAGRAIYNLVYYGAEWGEKLGRQLLEYPGFSPSLKLAAVDALMARGILQEGEPVPMFIEGQMRLVEIKKSPVMFEPDEELDKIVDQAIQLRDKGQTDRATALLQDLYREGKYYPRAMMILAKLMQQQDKLEDALQIMEMLEELAPEDPGLLFNLAALMLQMGEPQRARAYYERIDGRELGQQFVQKLRELEKEIELAEATSLLFQDQSHLVHMYAEEQRRKIEEKPLPVNPTLARGLKNMPVHWLEGACEIYGIEPARLRRDKEKQLAHFLTRRGNLEKAVRELQEEERELLKYLLQREGWSQLNAVSRKFGNMEGDGFFWDDPEDEPQSTLGFLWSLVLVMVGRTTINNRKCKIATIPVELRQPLANLLKNK